MSKHVRAFVCFLSIILPLYSALPQTRPDIGGFDIEKVRRAVTGDTSTPSFDSLHAPIGVPPARAGENWPVVIMRITLYLAITAGATFFVVWGIKRLGLAGRSKIRGGSMDVLEAVALGQNKSLALVRVVDKVYLIGQTQTQITLLDTMEGAKAIELIASSKGGVSMGQFKDVFNSFMDRFKAR